MTLSMIKQSLPHRIAASLAAIAVWAAAPALSAATPEDLDDDIQSLIAESLETYEQVQEEIAAQKAPMVAELNELEKANAELRAAVEQNRLLVTESRSEIQELSERAQNLRAQNEYIHRALDDYLVKFDSRIHLSESQRFNEALSEIRESLDQGDPSLARRYTLYAEGVSMGIDRAEEAIGGLAFNGRAVDPDGRFHSGRIAVLGPSGYFSSEDGDLSGMLRFSSGTLEPEVAPLDPSVTPSLNEFIATGSGQVPLDPSLGEALSIQESQTTLLEHIKQGGFVGYAIIVLGAIALIISLIKLMDLQRFDVATPEEMQDLARTALKEGTDAALAKASNLTGVVAEMINTGIRNVRTNAVLLEETMLSVVLRRQPYMERFLPFLAITAAAAPLLGLLGTVVGLIKTFALITLYGAGAPKALSSGISEALVTTELGLIVAIPTLILHGLFSRLIKTRLGVLEQTAFDFVKAVSLDEEAQQERGKA